MSAAAISLGLVSRFQFGVLSSSTPSCFQPSSLDRPESSMPVCPSLPCSHNCQSALANQANDLPEGNPTPRVPCKTHIKMMLRSQHCKRKCKCKRRLKLASMGAWWHGIAWHELGKQDSKEKRSPAGGQTWFVLVWFRDKGDRQLRQGRMSVRELSRVGRGGMRCEDSHFVGVPVAERVLV